MQKGFSMPILLILVLIILMPVAYLVFSKSSGPLFKNDIKGATTVPGADNKPGLGVRVISQGGTWDLVEYLCMTLDECTRSATSGKRENTISGGTSTSHNVFIAPALGWGDYKYLKYFVKPGWSSSVRDFKITSLGTHDESGIYELRDGSQTYEAVITTVNDILDNYRESVTFSDQ